jgi:UTP--glucose-1-phosphate uridylyltransferase
MATPQRVRKAVIPAAGYGTRFLPVTKAVPKEMLPIVDRPVIQYVVEEAVASGIEQICIVTSASKFSLEEYFNYNYELESRLKTAGKLKEFEEIRRVADQASFYYVRQKEQLGNGHAVLCAREFIGDEPFAVLWGDDFVSAEPPRARQLLDVYERHGGSVITVFQSTNPEDTKKYGIVQGRQVEPGVTRVESVVEKPGSEKAPSNLASIGGYIFTPAILPILEKLAPAQGGEIWLVDAINQLAQQAPVFACEYRHGRYYDCGNKLEWLKANIEFALRRPELADGLREYLAAVAGKSQ